MRIATLPGVFRPISDSWLLARVVCERVLWPGASVLDMCTGSGVVALCAARAGAGAVTAIDVSWRAMLTVRLNARLNGVTVRARRSDLFASLDGERFDVIVSNPPYVPSDSDRLPARGLRRAWEAGLDGRAFLDRLVAAAPAHLTDRGALVVVHSDLCGTEATRLAMAAGGLRPEVLARAPGPLGPLMRARLGDLRARGMLNGDAPREEVVVVAGRREGARSAGVGRRVV